MQQLDAVRDCSHPSARLGLPQEWSAFCEFATEVASAVDSGQLQESEGEERVQSALEYIVSRLHLLRS